jgi:triacylglycerol esterase/lipase EstA (alpha/beta hydrolase family)
MTAPARPKPTRHLRASDLRAAVLLAISGNPLTLALVMTLRLSEQYTQDIKGPEANLTLNPPVPALSQISVLAHSMGGLLIRSALFYASQAGLHWPHLVKHMVFLGTPHHGAPLERAGNWVDELLGTHPTAARLPSLASCAALA